MEVITWEKKNSLGITRDKEKVWISRGENDIT